MPAPISHIVVLMMENHSFDRMFGWLQPTRHGLEGVDPQHPASNPDATPQASPVPQAETRARNIELDPGHELENVQHQMAGGNQGFVIDFAHKYPNATPDERQEVMGWYPYGFLPALHFLGYNFVVCDHWFSSVPGPTWPNRLFAHSGTSLGHVDMPEGVFNPGLHKYDQTTLYDELDRAGVDWRIYHGDFPQSLLLLHQWSKLDHYRDFDQWAVDVRNGDLPPYVFIEPTYFGADENDQHPPHDVLRGDRLIAQVYNTLHANQAVFERTLLVVLYDEHGGFYDHIVPPPAIAPDSHTADYAFDQFGVRVPAVLVSPWLDPGYTSTVFDHTSLLRMAGQMWPGVTPPGARAKQANSPLDALTWRSEPRRAISRAPVQQGLQAARPLAEVTGQKRALYAFSQYLESQIRDTAVKAQLMGRAHEAMGGSMAQGKLATDRAAAFMAERGHPTRPV